MESKNIQKHTKILNNHFKSQNKQQTQQSSPQLSVNSDDRQLVERDVDDYHDLELQIHEVNILFFLKKCQHDNIIDQLLHGVQYIINKQTELKSRIVNKIYLEEWVLKQIPKKVLQNQYTSFELWNVDQCDCENSSQKNQNEKCNCKHKKKPRHIVLEQDENLNQNRDMQQVESQEDFNERNIHIDYIITIGGDGTILRLLSQIREYEKYRNLPPIITFSSVSNTPQNGSLNYLGNFDLNEMKQVIDAAVFKIDYDSIDFDPRMRLQLSILKNNVQELEIKTIIEKNNTSTISQQELQLMALNEITIMRNSENMVQIEVSINDVLLTVVQGDGLLIATPTGSTAYNLSCGGPIVHPSAQTLCLTPIAPHSLSFRPVILPTNEQVKIKIPDSARTSAKVTIDGHTKIDLNPDDCILIKRSPYNVPCKKNLVKYQYINIVRWKKQNLDFIWSRKLHKQLKWNQRIIQKPLKKLVVIKPKL